MGHLYLPTLSLFLSRPYRHSQCPPSQGVPFPCLNPSLHMRFSVRLFQEFCVRTFSTLTSSPPSGETRPAGPLARPVQGLHSLVAGRVREASAPFLFYNLRRCVWWVCSFRSLLCSLFGDGEGVLSGLRWTLRWALHPSSGCGSSGGHRPLRPLQEGSGESLFPSLLLGAGQLNLY